MMFRLLSLELLASIPPRSLLDVITLSHYGEVCHIEARFSEIENGFVSCQHLMPAEWTCSLGARDGIEVRAINIGSASADGHETCRLIRHSHGECVLSMLDESSLVHNKRKDRHDEQTESA